MPKPISLESIAAMLRKWLPAERIVNREPEEKKDEELPGVALPVQRHRYPGPP
jgi:hypothetical protein